MKNSIKTFLMIFCLLVIQSKLCAAMYVQDRKDLLTKDKQGNTDLHRAAKDGDLKEVKRIVTAGGCLDEKNDASQTPFEVVKDSKDSLVRDYLKKHKLLLTYSHMGNVEEVQKLLEDKDIFVSVKDEFWYTPLMHASEFGHEDVVALLLKHEPKPNLDVQSRDLKNTALYLAVFMGYKEIVKMLLDAGANTLLENDAGNTVFDIVGDNQVIHALLKGEG